MGSIISYFNGQDNLKIEDKEEFYNGDGNVSLYSKTTSKTIKYIYQDQIYEIDLDDTRSSYFITLGIISGNIRIIV